MRRYFSIALIVIITHSVYGQLAIIWDSEGFVNVREQENSTSRIAGRLFEGDIFGVYSPNDTISDIWWGVDYTVVMKDLDRNAKEFYENEIKSKDSIFPLTGFIHKSRFRFIEDLKEIKGTYQIEENLLTFNNVSITLIIKLELFNPVKHLIKRNKYGSVELIDNLQPRGVDGDLPSQGIKSIKMVINGKEVVFPKRSYMNLFQVNLQNIRLYIDKEDIYLNMPHNSDGAGSYDAVWLIRKGKLIKTYSSGTC